MTVDPVVAWLARLGLALLFGSAAWHKVSDPAGFVATMTRYRLLPARAVRPAAWLLPVAEACVACGLLLDQTVTPAAAAAAGLLGLYATAMGINLRRGRRNLDCGCFASSRRAPIHGALVARNVALMAVAVAAALPLRPRPLGWVDLATLGCGLLVTCVLWSAVQELTSNAHAPRAEGNP